MDKWILIIELYTLYAYISPNKRFFSFISYLLTNYQSKHINIADDTHWKHMNSKYLKNSNLNLLHRLRAETASDKGMEWRGTNLIVSFQGLSTKDTPTLELFSMAFVSTSPDNVMSDLGLHSCWIRALALPKLFTRALTVVRGSKACWLPNVRVFSLLDMLCENSPPTAVLVFLLTRW